MNNIVRAVDAVKATDGDPHAITDTLLEHVGEDGEYTYRLLFGMVQLANYLLDDLARERLTDDRDDILDHWRSFGVLLEMERELGPDDSGEQ